jgi:hypothetical protein
VAGSVTVLPDSVNINLSDGPPLVAGKRFVDAEEDAMRFNDVVQYLLAHCFLRDPPSQGSV